jgi:hypothetical protein
LWTFLRQTLLISVWFLGSFAITYPGVAYLERSISGSDFQFNALIFLPHGVRIFAIWLFRHQAILPLLIAHGLHIFLWGHWSPNSWLPPIAGTLSAYLAFELLRMARLNPFHVVISDRSVWGRLVLAGILAAALNTIILQLTLLGYDGPHDELERVLGYVIGDIAGILLFVGVLVSVNTVIELRFKPPED